TFLVDDQEISRAAFPPARVSKLNRGVSAGLVTAALVGVIGTGVWYRQNGNRPAAAPVVGNVRFERVTESGRALDPALSADNKNIAFVRSGNNEHSIVLRNIATGSETVIVGPKKHELASLSFSADSNHLFYIARETESPDSTISKVPRFGGTERKIQTGVRHFVSVSTSGKKLAYFRHDTVKNEYHLMESNADGSNERRIATRAYPEFFQDWNTYPAWSPDEKRIVVPANSQPSESRTGSEIYLVEIDVESGKETRLKHPAWDGIGNAFWTSDGTSLIVSAREGPDGFMQIWALGYPDGEAYKITNDTNDYRDFKLSADSKTIVAASFSSSADLFVVSTSDFSESRRLTAQNLANYGRWGLAWMPDGRHVVAVKNKARNDGNLFKIEVESGKETQITFFEKVSVLGPSVAPDGTVFFGANKNGGWHIWRVGPDGTGLVQVTHGADGENHPDVSADGRFLYFSRPGRAPTGVWRMILPDGKEEKLPTEFGGPVKISPTNPDVLASVYYAKDARYPWTVAVDDLGDAGGPIDLQFEPENHEFAWDSTGTGLFYGKKSLSVTNLWFKPLDNVLARQVTDFESDKVIGVAVSPDGSRIAVSREKTSSNLFLITGF
ncbi:MAG: hypothetical protein OEQ28_13080, partial [Acidobacteriota bacterium]|nr:hypothetical protein [Acidobacteriota bacterium]